MKEESIFAICNIKDKQRKLLLQVAAVDLPYQEYLYLSDIKHSFAVFQGTCKGGRLEESERSLRCACSFCVKFVDLRNQTN